MKFKVKGFNHYTCAPWRRRPYHPRSEAEWDHGPHSEEEWEDGVHLRCTCGATAVQVRTRSCTKEIEFFDLPFFFLSSCIFVKFVDKGLNLSAST